MTVLKDNELIRCDVEIVLKSCNHHYILQRSVACTLYHYVLNHFHCTNSCHEVWGEFVVHYVNENIIQDFEQYHAM